jgi:hypothetical protein
MPRFVVLTHDHPTLHWDLMLEQGDSLRTWRLAQSPDADGSVAAESLPDHRLAYLTYEGPVSGGRGTVEQWDRGTYELLASTGDGLVIRLAGQRLAGAATLRRSQDDNALVFQRLAPDDDGS